MFVGERKRGCKRVLRQVCDHEVRQLSERRRIGDLVLRDVHEEEVLVVLDGLEALELLVLDRTKERGR